MVYQVLARKWRPKTFKEVIGQDHVIRTLQNSILKEKIAHAYLFTGTRGVGKTTIARIFAKAIRCENLDEKGNPCLECSSCRAIDQSNALDYVEIDGASNNSVDNVRELIENAQYLPSSGKYKVYVVDEVHMLSTSAFNALLKTLEEPPAHVVFIFATTDPHKLLGTVLSRCQRFDFKSVSIEELTGHVKAIAEKENIKFDSDRTIEILARQGDGSVRDTLSLLDQALSLSSGETISEEIVLRSLGLARPDAIKSLTSALINKEPKAAISLFDELAQDNLELEKFSNQILDKMFEVIENVDSPDSLKNLVENPSAVLEMNTAELLWTYETLIKDLEWSLQAFDSLRAMRFSILKVCKRDEIVGKAQKKKPKLEAAKETEEIIKEENEPTPNGPIEKAEEPQIVEKNSEEDAQPEKQDASQFPKSWEGFRAYVKESHRGISMNLERAKLLSKDESPLIELGFTEDEKIFSDFLNEADTFKKLNDLAVQFFAPEQSSVKIQMIDSATKEKSGLYSSVEIEEKKLSDLREEKEKKLRENKFVKEAESVFNGKISKILLNDDEN